MSSTEQQKARDQMRVAALLGHPMRLDAAVVTRRRELLGGLPVTRDQATGYRVVQDLIDADEGFALNLAELQVDELVAALNVTSVEATEEGGVSQAEADQARRHVWECWERSDLGAGTEGAFAMAASDGQGFIVADYDLAGQPTAYVNATYDGATGVEVIDVSDDGTLMLAIKHHQESLARDRRTGILMRVVDWFLRAVGIEREAPAVQFVTRKWRTFYQYDRARDVTYIRQYVTDEGRAERQVRIDDCGEVVDVEPGYYEEWPHGYPIVPLVSPRGGELRGMRTPQRLVNAAALDNAAAARQDGSRMGYLLDCEPIGTADTHEVAGRGQRKVLWQPGGWLTARSADLERQGQIGVIEAGDLAGQQSNLKLQVELMRLLGRSITLLLPWSTTGQWPSGVALRLALKPYLDKVEKYQERWSVSLRALFELWQRMADLAVVRVNPVWAEVDLLTLIERLQSAGLALEMGVPLDQVATDLMHFDPDQTRTWRELVEGARQRRVEAVGAQREQASGEAGQAQE